MFFPKISYPPNYDARECIPEICSEIQRISLNLSTKKLERCEKT